MADNHDQHLTAGVTRREALKRIGIGAAGIAIAACGGSSNNNGVSPTNPPAGGPTTAAGAGGAATVAPTPLPPTPAVASIGKGSSKITFWHGLGGADGATLVGMLKEYSGQKDITVQSETYDWGLFYQKLPTSVVGKKPPDMAIMHEWAIPQFASQGLLMPSDELFFNSGLIKAEDFNPDVQAQITVDGVPQGVLFDNHGWGMYYNTDMVQKAGLDPAKVPANGDDWINWCLKLTTDDAGKHPDENGYNAKKTRVWGCHPSWLRPRCCLRCGSSAAVCSIPKQQVNARQRGQCRSRTVLARPDLQASRRAFARLSALPADLYGANQLALMWEGAGCSTSLRTGQSLKRSRRPHHCPRSPARTRPHG
ncbi:MAG: extracellular solute-binding protein [Chloroflexia bacterium]